MVMLLFCYVFVGEVFSPLTFFPSMEGWQLVLFRLTGWLGVVSDNTATPSCRQCFVIAEVHFAAIHPSAEGKFVQCGFH